MYWFSILPYLLYRFSLLLPDTKTKQHGLNPNATPHGPTGLS